MYLEDELTSAICYRDTLLLKLDPYGGAGPGTFPLFPNKTASYFVPKISTVFRMLIRGESFSTS